MNDSLETLAQDLVGEAASLFARGYSYGTAGNVSARAGDTVLATPTNASLATLGADSMAELTPDGEARSSVKPTKEINFHLGIYRAVAEELEKQAKLIFLLQGKGHAQSEAELAEAAMRGPGSLRRRSLAPYALRSPGAGVTSSSRMLSAASCGSSTIAKRPTPEIE